MNVLLITLSVLASHQAPVLNPAWKFVSNGQMESVSIHGDLMAYGMFEEYGVVDLKAGKVVWKHALKDVNWSSDVRFVGDTLYISSGNDTFKAVEPRTGKTIWSLPRKGFSSEIGSDGNRAFAELKMGVLSAIDLNSRKPVWTYDLDKGVAKVDAQNPRIIERPTLYDGKLVFNTTGGYVAALNPETGAVVWRTPIGAQYNFSLSFAGDSVLAWTSRELTALDGKTGRVKWKVAVPGTMQGEPAVVDGRIYFVTERPKAVCVSLEGRTVWSVPLGEPERHGNFDITGVTPTKDGLLIFDGGNLRWLSPEDGHEISRLDTLPTSLSQRPLPYEGDLLLVGTDLMVRLSATAAPEVFDPKQRATEMIGRMDKLNRAEMLEFSKMGPDAFEVLYQVTLKKLKEYRSAPKGPAGQKLFSFIYDAGELVGMSAKEENTDQLVSLYQAAKGTEAEGLFLNPLMDRGRDEATIPLALALIQRGDERSIGLALGKIADSKDPRAVKVLADALRNPKASEQVRSVAYVVLAHTGGPEEVELVRNARRTTRTLAPLAERMGLGGLGTTPTSKGYPELVATKKDAKGVLWGLVHSKVLGSGGDLWIVRRQGNRWVDPVFTGVKVERGFRMPTGVKTPPQKVQGLPVKDVLKTGWVKLFVGNAKLRVDTDKDGLTDLAEARLGTNAKVADSDGDGLSDATDGNPLAPDRQLSESERILAAAAEARYHDSGDYEQPALLAAPQGMKPFEIRGWGGSVIWTTDRAKHPLQQCWEEGTGFLSFVPRPDNDELPPNTPIPDRFIAWSPDGQTATVTISTYFGGLNGTGFEVKLRKFGNDWLVVGMRMSWIS